jgi:hypothetical protein
MAHQLRIYDPRSDAPQPCGPINLEAPENTSDEVIVEEIVRNWADPTRRWRIGYNGGRLNGPGFRLEYLD